MRHSGQALPGVVLSWDTATAMLLPRVPVGRRSADKVTMGGGRSKHLRLPWRAPAGRACTEPACCPGACVHIRTRTEFI